MTAESKSPASVTGLAGRRVLVIGASLGIERSFAVQALAGGGRVVATARRGRAVGRGDRRGTGGSGGNR